MATYTPPDLHERICAVTCTLPDGSTVEGVALVPWMDGEGPLMTRTRGPILLESPVVIRSTFDRLLRRLLGRRVCPAPHEHALVRSWTCLSVRPLEGASLPADRRLPVVTLTVS